MSLPDLRRSDLGLALLMLLIGFGLGLGQLIPGDSVSIVRGSTLLQPFLWCVVGTVTAAVGLFCMDRHGRLRTMEGENSRELRFRFLAVGTIVVMLSWVALSTGYTAGRGNLRFAVNVFWQWMALGILVIVLSWLEQCIRLKAVVLPWMLVLAVAASFHGLYQYTYSLPRDRQIFLENPEEATKSADIDAPEGSAVRMRMANRIESREPFGPFALANSLAGFLAPSFILLAAGLYELPGIRGKRINIAVYLFLLAMIAVVLLLTKSRSAWLAVIAGITFYGFMHSGLREILKQRLRWLIPVVTIAIFGTLLAILSVDARIVTEAPKSFLYRSQYWLAALMMIKDHPWLGVGPGNFQDNYSAYKLPTASENVYDPHNFLLEIGATCGLLPMAMMAMSVVGLGWLYWTDRSKPQHASTVSASKSASSRATDGQLHGLFAWLVGAGIVGALAVVTVVPQLFGGGPEILPYWLAAIGCAIWLVVSRPWRYFDELSDLALVTAILVYVVNLSAAGGWLAPGVMNLWIVCIAMLIGSKWGRQTGHVPSELRNHSKSAQGTLARKRSILEPIRVLALSVSLLLAWLCSKTMVTPILESRRVIETPAATLEQLERQVDQAMEIDPWEPHFAILKVQLAFRRLDRIRPGSAEWSDAKNRVFRSTERLIQTRPRFSKTFEMIGEFALPYREADAELASLAERAVVRSAELAPHEASVQLQAATVLWLSDKQSAAKSYLDAAIRLDSQTPHEDLKLRAHSIWLSPAISTRLHLENELQLEDSGQVVQLRSGRVPAEPWAAYLRSRL